MFINPEIIASSFMTALVIENKSYNELNKTQDSIRILPKLGKLKTEKKERKDTRNDENSLVVPF